MGSNTRGGRYICLLDADDLYAADYVKQLSEHIRKTDADFVFCGYDKLYEADRRTVPYEQFKAYPPTAKKELSCGGTFWGTRI